MQTYTDHFERAPVLVLPCLVRYREPSSFEGASIFPACQNLLLAARALGYGGVLTGFHFAVETELRELLGIPDDLTIVTGVTVGHPAEDPEWERATSVFSQRRRAQDEVIRWNRWDS